MFFILGNILGSILIQLESGKVQVMIDGQEKTTLGVGTSFGEMALLYNTQRSASIIALEDCGLWGLDRLTFKEYVKQMSLRNIEENKKFIENIDIFRMENSNSYNV